MEENSSFNNESFLSRLFSFICKVFFYIENQLLKVLKVNIPIEYYSAIKKNPSWICLFLKSNKIKIIVFIFILIISPLKTTEIPSDISTFWNEKFATFLAFIDLEFFIFYVLINSFSILFFYFIFIIFPSILVFSIVLEKLHIHIPITFSLFNIFSYILSFIISLFIFIFPEILLYFCQIIF